VRPSIEPFCAALKKSAGRYGDQQVESKSRQKPEAITDGAAKAHFACKADMGMIQKTAWADASNNLFRAFASSEPSRLVMRVHQLLERAGLQPQVD
jgi:hypothetical protein